MGFLALVYVRDAQQARMIRQRYNPDSDAGRIVGLYQFSPKDQDVCPGAACGKRERVAGFGMHSRLGYTVHGACGRRHREWKKRIKATLIHTFGINLLKRDETPGLFQNPQGWDRKK